MERHSPLAEDRPARRHHPPGHPRRPTRRTPARRQARQTGIGKTESHRHRKHRLSRTPEKWNHHSDKARARRNLMAQPWLGKAERAQVNSASQQRLTLGASPRASRGRILQRHEKYPRSLKPRHGLLRPIYRAGKSRMVYTSHVEKGREEGAKKEKRRTAIQLLPLMDDAKIAHITRLSLSEIKQLGSKHK